MPLKRVISVLSRELKFFYAQRLASFGFASAKKRCRQLFEPVMPLQTANTAFDLKIHGLEMDFFKDIDWQKDHKTGKVFPKLKFGKFNTNLFFDKGDDIKFPWDLSRCAFLPPLTAKMASEGKTADAYTFFRNTVESFIDNNKFLYGVNWVCTMEVAIRASNWLFAMPFIKRELEADSAFSDKVNFSLYMHAMYIDLFTEDKNNNHDISNYAGLLLLGIYFDSGKWIKKAIDGLEYEINKQILPDGCTYELSTYYNRLDLEFFATSYYMGKLHGHSFSKLYTERLHQMFSFSFGMMEEKGYMPIINDNDGGRYVIFNDGNENDFSYLYSFYNKIFDGAVAGVDKANVLFRSMPQVVRAQAGTLKKEHNVAYANSKFYKLGDGNFSVVASAAGSADIKKPGHKHIDAGSVYIGINGRPVFVDPGTSSYTRSLVQRNKERSIAAHNCAVPSSKIGTYTSNGGYWGKLPAYPAVSVTGFEAGTIAISMDFDGVPLSRKIEVEGNSITMSDVSEGEDLSVFFHSVQPFTQKGNVLLFDGFTFEAEGGEITVEDFNYAENYGQLDNKAYKIIIQGNSIIKTTITRS